MRPGELVLLPTAHETTPVTAAHNRIDTQRADTNHVYLFVYSLAVFATTMHIP